MPQSASIGTASGSCKITQHPHRLRRDNWAKHSRSRFAEFGVFVRSYRPGIGSRSRHKSSGGQLGVQSIGDLSVTGSRAVTLTRTEAFAHRPIRFVAAGPHGQRVFAHGRRKRSSTPTCRRPYMAMRFERFVLLMYAPHPGRSISIDLPDRVAGFNGRDLRRIRARSRRTNESSVSEGPMFVGNPANHQLKNWPATARRDAVAFGVMCAAFMRDQSISLSN